MHLARYMMLLKLSWVRLWLSGKFAYLAGRMSAGYVRFYYEFHYSRSGKIAYRDIKDYSEGLRAISKQRVHQA
jgi:hypothetical protein